MSKIKDPGHSSNCCYIISLTGKILVEKEDLIKSLLPIYYLIAAII